MNKLSKKQLKKINGGDTLDEALQQVGEIIGEILFQRRTTSKKPIAYGASNAPGTSEEIGGQRTYN